MMHWMLMDFKKKQVYCVGLQPERILLNSVIFARSGDSVHVVTSCISALEMLDVLSEEQANAPARLKWILVSTWLKLVGNSMSDRLLAGGEIVGFQYMMG